MHYSKVEIRMARAALHWSIEDLARHAGVTRTTVIRAEQGLKVRRISAEAIRGALERAGVHFLVDPVGPSVRLAVARPSHAIARGRGERQRKSAP